MHPLRLDHAFVHGADVLKNQPPSPEYKRVTFCSRILAFCVKTLTSRKQLEKYYGEIMQKKFERNILQMLHDHEAFDLRVGMDIV